jgi:uncharacterized protein YbjT (DUF2867 family)
MSYTNQYEQLELTCARNFREALVHTNIQQVIYLGGIANHKHLSKHLTSRKQVEQELDKGSYSFTALRAGIIIGSGSASFEILRDLVEKLPFMITPKWLNTLCQPISISNTIDILVAVLQNSLTYNKSFDIGGSQVLSYKEMMLKFAEVRQLKRTIWTLPIMTPKLSSYWLYFVTSTSYKLASALVESLKSPVICKNNELQKILKLEPTDYITSLKQAFAKIENDQIISSWKDAQSSGYLSFNISDAIQVPSYGCFRDIRRRPYGNRKQCIQKIWKIGGENGWYYANLLWKIRGVLDQFFGGVGLRRGRTHANTLEAGDAVDFWRVLYANKNEGRLLLYAEMKLPGEAWLEFKLSNGQLIQTATFRPRGVFGRLYWYSVLLLHEIVFRGLINQLTYGK